MSHRSGRSHDRDRSHKYDKYGKHEHRHHRDYDDYDDRYSGRSRYRSRSRSSGHGNSRRHSDHYSRSHRSKDYRESPDHTKSRYDSRHDYRATTSDSKVDKKSKHESSKERSDGPKNISSHQQDGKNYCSGYETGASDELKGNRVNVNEHDSELEREKERVQRETMERLQKHFEKEGRAYPPPKPQASHPIFANDGSFLEIFKKTIQQQQQQSTSSTPPSSIAAVPAAVVATAAATAVAAKESQTKSIISPAGKSNTIIPILPVKRRGAKILKTGIVKKQRIVEEVEDPQPADSWNAYLKEVKRYKTVTCSDDNMTRSLVK